MQPLTPDDVQAALDRFSLGIQIRFFDTPTATSQQAADNIGCELGQIVKSICFLVGDQPVMVLASGDQKVDDRKLAEFYSVSRKKVKVATPEQLVEIWGYEPGSVPPFGHRIADTDLHRQHAAALRYAVCGRRCAQRDFPDHAAAVGRGDGRRDSLRCQAGHGLRRIRGNDQSGIMRPTEAAVRCQAETASRLRPRSSASR